MKVVYVPTFSDRPSNPARCIIPTETIEINSQVWDILPDEQREFVFYHELGHCKGKTYDELKADDYALEQMALKKPYSLMNHYKSVKAISHNDKKRVENAMYKTLKISAREGNATAKDILKSVPYANAEGNTSEEKNFLSSLIVIVLILTLLLCYWILKK